MINFLQTVCLSMHASRRALPLPQDFAFALAELGVEPGQLNQHIRLKIPGTLSCPEILPPVPDEKPSVDLQRILGSSLCEETAESRPQIPSHFPPLPSKHTWMDTRHIAPREKDPRKIRERATQEGMVAEQALRKLAAAANKPRSRLRRSDSTAEKNKQNIWQDALASVLSDDAHGTSDSMGMNIDMANGTAESEGEGKATTGRNTMVINYDRAHWRKGAAFGSVRS